MRIYAIILAGILLPQIALAEDYMLPQSFSINEANLPKLQEPKKVSSVQQEKAPDVGLVTDFSPEPLRHPEEQGDEGAPPLKKLGHSEQSEESPNFQTKQILKQVQDDIKLKYVATDLSLTDLIRHFDYEYSKTLGSTMATLAQFDIKPLCYDSSKGQIRAKLNSGKEIFILLLPSQEKLTHVRITPADGNYDLSKGLIKDIFKNINRNLYSNVN